MSNEKFKKYTINAIALLKKQAIKAKKNVDNPKDGFKDYAQGIIMGYYSIVTLLKHQAFVFCMDQKELGLADINPDIDLLGLHRNPDADFGEDNWAIDAMNEGKIKGYLSDSIKVLKEQAREAKKDADHSKEDFDDYNKGSLMAYYTAISTLKNQAHVYDISQEDIGLADINPEVDLLT